MWTQRRRPAPCSARPTDVEVEETTSFVQRLVSKGDKPKGRHES